MTESISRNSRNSGNEGFTLVELLVVLAIIGLIAAIAAPKVLRYLGSAKVETTRTQIKNLESGLELFFIDAGRYPTTDEGLSALETKPANDPSWNGPYLKSGALRDAWGNPYRYTSPAEDKPFVIVSLGRDGKEGGEDQDADLRSN